MHSPSKLGNTSKTLTQIPYIVWINKSLQSPILWRNIRDSPWLWRILPQYVHSQPFFPKGEVALSLFGEGPAEINRHDLVDFGIALVYIVKDTLLLINSPSFAKFTSIFPRCASATVSTLIVIFLLSFKAVIFNEGGKGLSWSQNNNTPNIWLLVSVTTTLGSLSKTTETATKTSLIKWSRTASNLIALIPCHSIRQMLAIFPGLEF